MRLTRTPAVCLCALLFCLAGCQTADRGTSTVTSPGQATEPTEAEPRPVQTGANDSADSSGFEPSTCEPRSVYRTLTLDGADPAACRQICTDQMRCMAATYAPPGDDGEKARCELQHSVPRAANDKQTGDQQTGDRQTGDRGCFSWINPRAEKRMAQMRAKGFEWNVDRPGGDFRDFEMDRPEPESCQEACQNLRDCKAFTYVRPGEDGTKAHCHLKDQVPEQVDDQDCCISGLK